MARLCFYFLALCSLSVQAQHQYDNWFFGLGAGMNFGGGTPVNISGSALHTSEGSSVMSDASGNVLFYTDGMSVYNKNHEQMPNGFGLLGAMSSTQSGLIVPDPASPTQYYIFTVPENFNPYGLRYSKVDLTLNGGLGDVTTKNVMLVADADEKLTAIKMASGDGFWVLTHTHPNSLYHAFPVTASGIGTAVVSQGEMYVGLNPGFGHLKLSTNGWLANCMMDMNALEIGRFNDTTGAVHSTFLYQMQDTIDQHLYAAEFSPSGSRLYIGNGDFMPGLVFQMDMTSGDSATMVNSVVEIFSDPVNYHGAMQLAPDQKIYIAQWYNNKLDVIQFPELLGSACGYLDEGFELDSMSLLGLPATIVDPAMYLLPQATVQPSTTKICPDSCVTFNNQSTNASGYQWFFPGGVPSFSTDENPTVCYAASGMYNVTLIAFNGVNADTFVSTNLIQVYAPPVPSVTLINDTLFASSVSGSATFQWFLDGSEIAGATNAFCVAVQNGMYHVVATSPQGCSGSDNFYIQHLGIGGSPASTLFSIYPSPAGRTVTVEINAAKSNAAYTVYNTLGQHVMNGLVENKLTLDVSRLPAAVYHIVIQTVDGTAAKRLLIAR